MKPDIRLCLLAAASLAAGAAAQPGGRIVWTMDRLRNDRGVVRCFLFSGPDGYPSDVKKSVARTTSVVSHGAARCTFEGFPPGEYALSAYHDENDNDRFDTNFFGLPKEGHAASNDSNGAFGPRYGDAHFTFDGSEKVLPSRFFY